MIILPLLITIFFINTSGYCSFYEHAIHIIHYFKAMLILPLLLSKFLEQTPWSLIIWTETYRGKKLVWFCCHIDNTKHFANSILRATQENQGNWATVIYNDSTVLYTYLTIRSFKGIIKMKYKIRPSSFKYWGGGGQIPNNMLNIQFVQFFFHFSTTSSK